MMHLRTWLSLALAVVLALAPFVSLAQTSGAYYYWWNVTDERGEPFTGENVQCSVFKPNTHAALVVHTSATLASGGNSPLFSDVNGKLHFYSSANTPVDVNCYYAGGGSAQINKFRITDHKMVIPRQSGAVISRFAVNSTSATYQSDSGIVIPGGSVVRDIVIQNLNPQGLGTYHLTVGFLGNHSVATANALVATQALSSPDEWLRPHVITTIVSNVGYYSASHRGTALQRFTASHGSGVGDLGMYAEVPYMVHVASGLGISYSAQPGTGAGVRAHVYVIWQRLHSAADRFGRNN